MKEKPEFAYADNTTMRFSQEIMRKFGHPMSVDVKILGDKLYVMPGTQKALCVRKSAGFSSICIRGIRKDVPIPSGKMQAVVKDGEIVVDLSVYPIDKYKLK